MQIKFKFSEFENKFNFKEFKNKCKLNSNLKNLKSFIPAQSKASFFPQKDFKFFKFEYKSYCELRQWILQ